MQTFAQVLVLVALAVVALLPGAALAAATGITRMLPVYLLPGTWLTLTLATASVICAGGLALHTPLAWMTAALGVVTVVALLVAWRRARRALAAAAASGEHDAPRRFSDRLAEVPSIVPASMMTAGAVMFIAATPMAMGDPLYHASVITKLAELPSPSFSAVSLFRDGSAHPGYLLPAWHLLVAMAGSVADAPVTAFWLAPALIVPLAVVTFAGLCYVTAQSHAAAGLGAVVALVAGPLSAAPGATSLPLAASAYPGNVAVLVVIPVAISAMIVGLRRPGPAGAVVTATALAALAVAVVAVLHISYLAFVAISITGYLAVWGLGALDGERRGRRHALVAAAIAVGAALAIIPLLPAILSLHGVAAVGARPVALHDWFVGTPAAFHLDPQRLVPSSGLALVGVVAAPLLVLTRLPIGALAAGVVFVLVLLTQVDALYVHVTSLMSFSQSRRLGSAMPWQLGATGAALLVAITLAWIARRGGRGATVLVAATIAVAATMLLTLDAQPEAVREVLGSRGGVTALALLAVACTLIARRRAGVGALTAPMWATSLMVVVIVVGSQGDVRTSATLLAGEWRARPGSGLRVDELARLPSPVVDRLRALPPGSVVLAPLHLSLHVAAVAPVYIVGAPTAQVARTASNDASTRRDALLRAFGTATSASDVVAIFDDHGVDAVLVAPPTPHGLREALVRAGMREVARGTGDGGGHGPTLYARR